MDNKVSKKSNILLVFLVVLGVAIIGVGAFMMFNNKESVDNTPNDANNGNEDTKIIYHDDSRDLKDTYTFKEATSRFAFEVMKQHLYLKKMIKQLLSL